MPVAVCEELAPMLLERVKAIQEKFGNLFREFGGCHRLYNAAKVLDGSEIDELGEWLIRVVSLAHIALCQALMIGVSFFFLQIVTSPHLW